MKLAIVVPGGVDRSATDRVIPAFLSLFERLSRRHDVHIFATRQEPEPGEWSLLGARVHNIGMARGTTHRLVVAVSEEHAIAPFDLIHAFFGWCGASSALAGWRCRLPMLFHAAGDEFVGLDDIGYGMRRSFVDSIASRVAVRGARRVTVATRFMQGLAKDHGVASELVPLGVALDRWPVAAPRPRDRGRPARLLHIGDVRPVKDHGLLMRAAVQLKRAGVRFELDVAGLDTADGPLQQSREAKELGDAFRGHGVLRRDALRALIDRADLLLVTSRHEAGPLVVLEAAIAGVPTVGTAVGHIADWSRAAAVAVPIGDTSALVDEVAALLTDEPRRMAIATEAQTRAIAIDADFTAASFERIYTEMLAR
jgi:glycosyltransferase involved in cell wall biosynthesis